MVLAVIVSVCFIGFLLHVMRDFPDEKGRRARRARNSKEYSMEGTRKKSSRLPETNRNAPGRNWEKFKSVIVSTTKSDTDIHNVPRKSHVKQKRKSNAALMNMATMSQMDTVSEEVHEEHKQGLTKHIAMDCEMVGIGDGTTSMIARVSIVNRHGYCLYDKYVKARESVTDYRTEVSGIRPDHLVNGEDFEIVQKEVAEILKHKVLIGHALKHDLDVLYLSHPRKFIRDTSRFKPFRQLSRGSTPSLKKLAHELLGRRIQTGEHSSVEDARAAMQLYVLYKNKWESDLYSK